MRDVLRREGPPCPARQGRVLGWAVAGAFLVKGLLWLALAAASWATF
jgi:hypothetical protein